MLGWCAETTLIAAGLATLAAAASRWGRLTPETRHALWLVVLLRFLVPPVVAWPWAWGDSVPATTPVVVAVAAAPATAAAVPDPPAVPEPRADVATMTPEPAPGPPAVRDLPADSDPPVAVERTPPPAVDRKAAALPFPFTVPRPEPTAPPSARRIASIRVDWRSILAIAWLVGSVVVAGRRAGRIVRFGRALRRQAEAAPGWLVVEVATLAARFGVEAPPVAIAAGLPTPLLWCLGTPRLVVPAALLTLPADARAGLLAHELAHLARRDHWVARLALGLGLVWWWNPVFRLAARRLRDEAEAACDARVVRLFPADRFAYAEALVAVCAQHARPAPPLPALGIGGPSAARTLESRLLMILRDPIRPPTRRALLAALALLCLSVPTWTLARQESVATKEEVATQALIQKLEVGLQDRTDDLLERYAARVGNQVGTTIIPGPKDESPPAAGTKLTDDPTRPGDARGVMPLKNPILQIRRDALAAEVARSEAELERARIAARNTAQLSERKAVSRNAVDLSQAALKVVEAQVAREQAKLAEADALLAQSDPVAARPVARELINPDILRARRDAQAAEVEEAEAERDRAQAGATRADTLLQRNAIGRNEYYRIQATFKIAKARLARQTARLAEADTLLAQPDAVPVPTRIPNRERDLLPVLQARRDAQAAEVMRFEAERDRAMGIARYNAKLGEQKVISRNEVDRTQADLRVAEAAVAREQARLAEADALLAQWRPTADAEPGEASVASRPAATFGDYRDLVELAEMRLRVKQVEFQQAGARADRVRKSMEVKTPLAKEGRITQREWAEAQNEVSAAQEEVQAKEAEFVEAELRLKQAKRRADYEEGRLKRQIERTKAELDRMKEQVARNVAGPGPLAEVRGRYDDLMSQLDPGYKPEAEPMANPARSDQPTELLPLPPSAGSPK